METKEVYDTSYFIGHMFVNKDNQWVVKIVINKLFSLDFLVDTGADIVCISLKDLPGSMLSQIQKTNESIRGPDGSRLDVVC